MRRERRERRDWRKKEVGDRGKGERSRGHEHAGYLNGVSRDEK